MRVFFGLNLSLLATPFGGFSLSANAIVPHQQTDSLSGVLEHQKSYSCNLPLIFVLQKSRKLTVQFCCIQFENSISKENKSARDRALAARRFVGSVNSLGEALLYRWQPKTTTIMKTILNARWWGVDCISGHYGHCGHIRFWQFSIVLSFQCFRKEHNTGESRAR